MEPEVTRWAIRILGAASIVLGLATRFAKGEGWKDTCAVIAFTCAGTALIVSQT